jgi:ribosomal protein S18 acetylase RimI-like enzyme
MSNEAAESLLRAELDSEREFVVATENGVALGYAIFKFVKSPETPVLRAHCYCYLREIGVDPRARRRGVGSALLQHVREVSEEAGVDDIELDVWAFNESGRRFFQIAGFEVFATKMRVSGSRQTSD